VHCAATGYTVTICRTENYRHHEFIWCPAASIINITSATVGSTYRYMKYRKCTITDNQVQCRTPTNSPEITHCNGRRNCSLGLDAFNYPETFSCRGRRRGNFINITYNCIAGKRKCSVIRLSLVIRWNNSIIIPYYHRTSFTFCHR